MSSKKHTVVKELDPSEVSGFTDAQKSNYQKLGYNPCLMANGKIKWLTSSQRAIRGKVERRFLFGLAGKQKPKSKRYTRKHKKRSSNFKKFLHANWFFISLLILIAIALALIYLNWNHIF